jgi:hypothetical protein
MMCKAAQHERLPMYTHGQPRSDESLKIGSNEQPTQAPHRSAHLDIGQLSVTALGQAQRGPVLNRLSGCVVASHQVDETLSGGGHQ